MLRILNITTLLSGLCLAYIGHTVWTMYHMFHVPQCDYMTNQCIDPWLFIRNSDGEYSNTQLSLVIYGSEIKTFKPTPKDEVLYKNMSFNIFSEHEIVVNVSLPRKTFKSGKYYMHAYLIPLDLDFLSASQSPYITHVIGELTKLQVPQLEAFNLMGNASEKKEVTKEVPVPHLRSRLTLSVMTEEISLQQNAIPSEIYQYIYKRIDHKTKSYLPIALVDDLSFRLRDLQIIKEGKSTMPLTIVYKPMSVGKLRLWTNFGVAFDQLKGYGFGEKEVDEVKGMFADTNFYFLILTFCVSALHILFDTLAFKNDISYWRNRNTMVGLSKRAVVWRCVSTIIILFYLIDSDTSLLVSVPTGISALIEIWKLKKAFKITFNLSLKPFTFGSTSSEEKETEEFDATAMSYLSYLLYPLVIAGAVYSLLYTPHKSWYSWAVQSLVNGVYAFGFLFMLPQLFVNYKLKSVAHLPWKAFMYKAFNTFIDDIFAFIITMPTAHRVACFRDDLVFVIYLYQRWLYPVDKKRVNEFGQSFEEPQSDGQEPKLKAE